MATRTAETTINLNVRSTIKNTLDDSVTASAQLGSQTIIGATFETGVSANQGNRFWENKSLEIANAATTDLDLYDLAAQDIGAGTGRDAIGQLIVFEEVMTLIIKNASTSTGNLEIRPTDPANPAAWVPIMTTALGNALKPGGVMMIHQPSTDGFDITDASNHLLRLGAVSGAITVEVYILARHDDDDSSSSSTSSLSSSSSSQSSSTSSLSSQSESSSSSSLSSSSSSETSLSSTSVSSQSSLSSSST